MRSHLLAALLLFAAPAILIAQEFRVETSVFRGAQQVPFARALTLFSNGVFYDFSLTGSEITVFDLNGNRFVMLNVKDQVKTTLTTQDVIEVVASIKANVTDKNPMFFFAANPQFESTPDEIGMTIKLDSKPMTYSITGTVPQKREFIREYQSFANWSARLNALQSGMPPFARIEVNKNVADLGWAPESIELTMRMKSGFVTKEAKLRSTHRYNWTLSNPDKQRIEKVGDHLANFTELPYIEYRNDGRAIAQAEK
ncbi:MAG: hypothetical protein ACI9G1_003167 [Pirellulaceae bacterium]|jgi:hypothetical protein